MCVDVLTENLVQVSFNEKKTHLKNMQFIKNTIIMPLLNITTGPSEHVRRVLTQQNRTARECLNDIYLLSPSTFNCFLNIENLYLNYNSDNLDSL